MELTRDSLEFQTDNVGFRAQGERWYERPRGRTRLELPAYPAPRRAIGVDEAPLGPLDPLGARSRHCCLIVGIGLLACVVFEARWPHLSPQTARASTR